MIAGRCAPAIACAAALLLGACSDATRSYADLPALAEAVAGAGVACDGVDRKKGADLVSEIGSCRGDDVTLYVFDTEKALEDWKRVGPLAGPAVVGSNWAVTGEAAAVQRVAAGLGGETTGAPER